MPNAIVIDDKPLTGNSLVQMLNFIGITARYANSARSGVALLREKKPGLIFLDINMPGVNGFEFLSFLHSQPALSDIPIFIVTSDDQPETARKARMLGAVDVLIKPVSVELLQSALKRAKIVFIS